MSSALFQANQLPFSWLALGTMLVVLGVSTAMFIVLVRRWTSRRQWVSLSEWCREHRFRLRPARREALPSPLLDLVDSDAQIRFHVCDERVTFVQFDAAPLAAGAAAPRFNVLIRRRPVRGPIAGLRPAAQKAHLIDLLPLSRYASLTLGERFIIYASESAAARRLAESPAAGLMPQDLGLILLEEHVVLDFSSRPFDPIEFGRLISLSEQLSTMVI